MKKRVIDFDVAIDTLDKMPTCSETIRVSFDWDEKEDVMKAATRALDIEIGNTPLLINYEIYYWWWIE